MSFCQQYHAVGSPTYHSQRTRKPFSVWAWWIVNCRQGFAVRNRVGGRERAYPGLWEVHQNSHCSSSSRCRQSWACLLRLSAESCWRSLFHTDVMLLSVLSDSFSPSSCFPVLLSLCFGITLLKCKCVCFWASFKCIFLLTRSHLHSVSQCTGSSLVFIATVLIGRRATPPSQKCCPISMERRQQPNVRYFIRKQIRKTDPKMFWTIYMSKNTKCFAF